ncbi:MAG: hypothetical protein IGS50_20555 [Synechococcales cyanobacterium C42_A2020_086]|nr:hypothetical protein [Synechococcales cyanobacterium C42_A2020_086]
MTSEKAQLQALINGIDAILDPTQLGSEELSSNAMQQRQVLEQTRQYLLSLQAQREGHRLPESDAVSLGQQPPAPTSSPAAESAQQVLQAVLQEMNYLRVNMLQPLRLELEGLQRQREALTQELRQLEAQRQQYGSAAMSGQQQLLMEFLQSAMGQLQANLSGQVNQMMAALASQEPALLNRAALPSVESTTATAEQLEQWQQMQFQSDQLLLKLDATLRVIFESLNRNVQTYQDSLEQGLSRMHSLGQQGETMFAALVNRLAQQLAREASAYLQQSISDGNWPSNRSLSGTGAAEESEPDAEASTAPLPPLDALFAQDGNSATLEALDQELNQLDLTVAPPDMASAAEDEFLLDPLQVFAASNAVTGSESSALESPPPELSTSETTSTAEPSPVGDLESALDLLNQLNVEFEAATVTPPEPPSIADIELITAPESLYDEEFYHSLFQAPESSSEVLNPDSSAVEQSFDAAALPDLPDSIEPEPSTEQSLQASQTLAQEPAEALSSTAELNTPLAADAATDLPPDVSALDAITSLLDLIPGADREAPDAAHTEVLVSEELPSEVASSSALPADLLPIADAPSAPLPLESLDSPTQLSDAATLETVNPPDFLLEGLEDLGMAAAIEPAEQAGAPGELTLDEFSQFVESASAPAPEPSLSLNTGFTLDRLEDLFGELPDTTPDTATEADFAGSAESAASRLDPAIPEPIAEAQTSPAASEAKKKEVDATAEAPLSTASEFTGELDPNIDPNITIPTGTLDELIQSLTQAAAAALPVTAAVSTTATPPSPPTEGSVVRDWYLGMDIGTTGISAVLLHRSPCQLYPIYWQEADPTQPGSRRRFRLPTVSDPRVAPILQDWKPLLSMGLTYQSPQTNEWEPLLQWSDEQALPLHGIQQALQQLLSSLNPDTDVRLGALGLEPPELQTALRQLAGVVVGCPAHSSEAYRFNLREVILAAGLVAQPDQILFIEDTIAILLSTFDSTQGQPIQLPQALGQSGQLLHANWQGLALVVQAGAHATELALVNLPEQKSELSHAMFSLRSLLYGGNDLDQDILCTLLYPALTQAQAATRLDSDWDLEVAALNFSDLRLADLELPAAAELNPLKRQQVQQRLNASPTGQALLEIARWVKYGLHQQNRFTLKWGERISVISRQDLTTQVVLPYVQRLNRELNALLVQTESAASAVQHVICTGGTASLAAITRWLRQKLPNATIIQDTYPSPASAQENCFSSCSRVSYGLATLPLHPQVIHATQHRYSDYFLLLELLRIFPDQALSLEDVMQRLQQRGLDTSACQPAILRLLEGPLPPGLVPEADRWLTSESAANPLYQALHQALRSRPLFEKRHDHTYSVNLQQQQLLQQYMMLVLTSAQQKLDRPLQLAEVEPAIRFGEARHQPK